MPKIRLDVLAVERGLAESRSQAQRLILGGMMRVDGQPEYKPAVLVSDGVQLELEEKSRFVSRGGDKLQAALDSFVQGTVQGLVCADIGASTGGFTDCLLQAGAVRIYAIDVGYGQLSWKLRSDRRVVSLEKTNARYLKDLPEKVDLITIDASFISLALLLPPALRWLKPAGQVIALVKPQFEAGREEAAPGKGVIRDKQVHQRVLQEVAAASQQVGFAVLGLIRSPVVGPKGNHEFLIHLAVNSPGLGLSADDLQKLIEETASLPPND